MNDFNQLNNKVDSCNGCPELNLWIKFDSNLHGNHTSKLMIVSEAPSKESIFKKQYWYSSILRSVLWDTYGYDLEDVFYLTDIVKCCMPDNRRPKLEEIGKCTNYILSEIQLIEPTVILALGKEALNFFKKHFKPDLTGKITEIHNGNGYKVVRCCNFQLIPLIHPSNLTFHIDYYCYKRHLTEVFGVMLKNSSIHRG